MHSVVVFKFVVFCSVLIAAISAKTNPKSDRKRYQSPNCFGGTAPNTTHFIKLPSFLWQYGVYTGCRTSQMNLRQGSLLCNSTTQEQPRLESRHSSPLSLWSYRPKIVMFPKDQAYYTCSNLVECTQCQYLLVCDECGWMDIVDIRNCTPKVGCQKEMGDRPDISISSVILSPKPSP